MEEKKVKSYLIELVQKDKTVMENGQPVVKKGEVRKAWYYAEPYPKDKLDLGSYWEKCDSSSFWPTTADGVDICDDTSTICDRIECYNLRESEWPTEPGQWLEFVADSEHLPVGEWTVRITAYDTWPEIDVAATLRDSDLSRVAASCIRINGVPLYKPGSIYGGTAIWFPDVTEFVAKAVEEKINAKGGSSATATVRSDCYGITHMGKDGKFMRVYVILESKSRGGLVEFLRNLGVPNPEEIQVDKTCGDANGVTCCVTCVNVVDELEGRL